MASSTAPDAFIDGDTIVFDADRATGKELGAKDIGSGRYTLPATVMNARAIVDADPDLPDLSGALLRAYPIVDDPRLYDYQREAAGRLANAPHGQIAIVPPGAGKTAAAIAAADSLPGEPSVLVVCPSSLVPNWWREIEKWGSRESGTQWAVESWDKVSRLAKMEPKKWMWEWDIVILDESVLGKSRGSQRYKNLRRVRKYWGRVWLLSGSPTTRYADDLWTQLNLIWPKAFPSYWRFAKRYCTVEETVWGDKVTGNRKGMDVTADNADLIFVMNPDLGLPEYIFETVDVTLGPRQRTAYASMAADFIAELSDGTEVISQNEIGRLGKLQQITSWWDGESAKHDELLRRLEQEEGPHLVWTHWAESAAALVDRLNGTSLRIGHVGGVTRKADREVIFKEFREGRLDVLVLSIGVGKFGHTFTNVKTMWYVDKTWAADDYFQSLRRVRRIGLKHRPKVITLRAPGTTDEMVEANLEGKLGGISRLTRSDLAELLRGLGKE